MLDTLELPKLKISFCPANTVFVIDVNPAPINKPPKYLSKLYFAPKSYILPISNELIEAASFISNELSSKIEY